MSKLPKQDRIVGWLVNADGLLAIWDRNSRGTKHCIVFARDHSLPVEVFEVFEDNETIVSRFNF